MKLSHSIIERIRASDLDIGDEPFFVKNHRAFPSGYIVSKSSRVAGNSVPGYEVWFRNHKGIDEPSDAPCVYVYHDTKSWICEVSLYAPGPGAGDFRVRHEIEESIIETLLDYFFTENIKFNELLSVQINR
nr:hypothetical protein [Pseudomonas luteola]